MSGRILNPVALVLCAVAAAGFAGSAFLSEAPNRLSLGQPIMIWQCGPGADVALALGLATAAGAIGASKPRHYVAAGLIVSGWVLSLMWLAGDAAATLALANRPAARTALGPAFWLGCGCCALMLVDAAQRVSSRPFARLAIGAPLMLSAVAMIHAGLLDHLSVMREYAAQRSVYAAELGRHLALVAATLVIAIGFGAPLGLFAVRRRRFAPKLFAALNVVQTIPSIALFGLLIVPLSALGVGIGFVPALTALVLYALLPVTRGTAAALGSVDPGVIESARGMGFSAAQILWQIELPLALPVLLAGLRVVLVQTIGLAVVAALIGAGGLGDFVFQGIGQYAEDLVLLGALSAIGLALAADLALRTLIALAGGAAPR